jgi:hypothetical protein
MIRIISSGRIAAVLCLLLTLVISLWIGENLIENKTFSEGLTVDNLNMGLMTAPAPAPAPAGLIKQKMMEGFQMPLRPEPVNSVLTIDTAPKIQPPFPEKYSITNVFEHIFGMSNPNERFEIPKI